MWCVWSIWTSKTRWDRIIYAPEIHQELSSKHLIHDTMQTWTCKLLCPYTTSVTEEQPYSLAPELHLGWGQVCTKALDFLAMERDYLLSWVVVSNICYFHPYLGKIPILTNIFQMGWNHQPGDYLLSLGFFSANISSFWWKIIIPIFTKGLLLFFNIHRCSVWAEPIGNSHKIPAWQQAAKG